MDGLVLIRQVSHGATITGVTIYVKPYFTSANGVQVDINDLEHDPVSGNCSQIWSDLHSGVTFKSNHIFSGGSTSWTGINLGSFAIANLQNNLSSNWFAVGFDFDDADINRNVNIEGHTDANRPYIVVDYTVPNAPPTLNLTAPSSDVTVTQGNNVTIQWTDSDPDNNAAIFLYRDTDNDPQNGSGSTYITLSLSEDPDGSGDQYVWNTSGVPVGIYYIWGMIYDSVNPEVYDLAPGRVNIQAPNTSPTLNLTAPASDVTVTQGANVTIQWTDSDPDNNAAIFLYRDTDNNPQNGSGSTYITLSLSEDPDGSGDQYAWNTSGVPVGTYYIWGMIYDAVNPEVYDLAPGRVTIILEDPLVGLYGQPVEHHTINVFSNTYSIIGLSKVANPQPDQIVFLPFYGNPTLPKSSDLITDSELAGLVIDKYLFNSRFVDPFTSNRTLEMYIEHELIPLRDYYQLDTWWESGLETAFPPLRLFSKRKVDRITIGNTAVWAGNELLAAKITGGAKLIELGPSFLQFLYEQGRLDYVYEDEYQALVFAQSYYGADLDTFQNMSTLTHLPELKTLWEIKESVEWSKSFLDVEVGYAALEDAVKNGNLNDIELANVELSSALEDLGYRYTYKLANDLIFTPIGTFELEEEAQALAWLSDAHSEAIHVTAKDLAVIGNEIKILSTGIDTQLNREKLRNNYYDFVFLYSNVLYPLHMEHLGVQYTHLKRVDANVIGPLKWWTGVTPNTISALASDYDFIVNSNIDYQQRFDNILRDSLKYQAYYQGALTSIAGQDTDRLLRFSTNNTPVVACCQNPYLTTQISILIENDYATSIQTLTTSSQSVTTSSIGFSSGSVNNIPGGGNDSININVYVPEDYFTYNDGKDFVELPITTTWTTGGKQFSRTFQYHRQLGGRNWFKRGMNHAQTGNLLENLSQ